MTTHWRKLAIAAAFICLNSSAYAEPGGIQISPILIDIPHDHGMTSVRVHNWREKDVSFETEIMDWTQDHGEDVLTPSSDVLIAPSTFNVPAGGEQIVRMALKPQLRNGAAERAYRLLVRELPDKSAVQNGLKIQIQMSMPVFVTPSDAKPALTLEAASSRDGATLTLKNDGTARIRVVAATADGEIIADKAPRYLLAGAVVTWARDVLPRTLRVEYMAGASTAAQTQTFDVDSGR